MILLAEEQADPIDSKPLSEFMLAQYPEVEELIPGMVAVGAHTLASATRGLGKSHLATTIGVSLAAGESTLPGFDVTRSASVLYLDGEMAPGVVQNRFALHLGMLDLEPADLDDHLHVTSRVAVQAERGERLPSLATPKGRDWLLRELAATRAEVVIVDTVRALMRHPAYSLNDEEGWRPCEELLCELTANGVSLIYLHHTGKGGQQLGTSAREFDPSYVLELNKPKRAGRGWCRFRLEETKGRMGPSFAPREYVLEPSEFGAGSQWSAVEAEQRTKAERILEESARDPVATAATIAEKVDTTDSHVRSVLSKDRRTSR